MKKWLSIVFVLQSYLLFQQTRVNYYKSYKTNFGVSAISHNTLSVKTFSFNYSVYKTVPDTIAKNLIIGIRQKDASGRLYTNRGYHLKLNENDSISGILEDNKFDLKIVGDFLILSNENKSSRFNLTFGYEQFEYPSKIIHTISKNRSGLTYNPSVRSGNDIALSCVNLNDGSLLWSAPIPAKYNWNSLVNLNDSVILIAAGGLHAVNINTGVIWSYTATTAQKISNALTFSPFNSPTFSQFYFPVNTSREESQITQIASNILVSDDAVFFAAKDKMIGVDKNGKLIWETDMTKFPISDCWLFDTKDNVLLLNFGFAQYNDNTVLFGKPFILAFDKKTGNVTLEKNEESFGNIIDFETIRGAKILANKNQIIKISDDLSVETLIDLVESKYGRFLEFVDGTKYFVEKEGFFVPLNFINDNVVYFKSDHGKVFGLSNKDIEYEYHFTELYTFSKKIGNKTMIAQKNKTLLISENYELLYNFNCGEIPTVLKDKIYFGDGRLLYIVNENDLK